MINVILFVLILIRELSFFTSGGVVVESGGGGGIT